VPHDQFECLGRNSQIDQSLSTATAQVMGTGKFLPWPKASCNFTAPSGELIAGHCSTCRVVANKQANMFVRQATIQSHRMPQPYLIRRGT
jgi:hypothetical protein